HYSFFLTGSTTTQTYTLSLHDALPIYSAYFPFHGFNNDPPWGRLGGRHSDRSRSSNPSRVGLPSPTPRRIPATQLEHRQAPLALGPLFQSTLSECELTLPACPQGGRTCMSSWSKMNLRSENACVEYFRRPTSSPTTFLLSPRRARLYSQGQFTLESFLQIGGSQTVTGRSCWKQ